MYTVIDGERYMRIVAFSKQEPPPFSLKIAEIEFGAQVQSGYFINLIITKPEKLHETLEIIRGWERDDKFMKWCEKHLPFLTFAEIMYYEGRVSVEDPEPVEVVDDEAWDALSEMMK